MVAIITDRFKKQILNDLFTDVTDSADTYYIAIGRSQDWNATDVAPTPINTARTERDFRVNMQAMKKGEDVSYVIPRYNWSSGTIYSGYDDNIQGYPTNAYYVMTDELAVFMCLQQGRDAQGNAVTSTIKPSGSSLDPITTSDGYVWKYLYGQTALRSTKFTSANYIPVQFIDSADGNSPALEQEQKNIQNAAVSGQVLAVKIDNGGTGYTSAPSVTFTGNGTKVPQATATVYNGSIVKIEMNDSGTGKAFGSGYDYGSVTFSGGGGAGAHARIVLSPLGGLASDPREDLRSTALMFNTKLVGDEDNALITSNDFRQVGLIKNPDETDSASSGALFTATAGNVLNKLKFGSIAQNFSEDKTIQGSTSAAQAYVDKFDSNYVWYHQSDSTGYLLFQEGETVTELDGNGEGILDSASIDADTDAFTKSTVKPFSGTLLYVDNRAAIERDPNQTEDIKVIIQL
jgi:hypothetical protein|tara:strand:- start:2067 stop:3446 length:1380 start_codon:yes stop_codon:yes gene_type:complete